MEYKEIISEILDVYKVKPADFAQRVGIQRSSISHILSGRNKPSLEMMMKIKEFYPELRWDYLLLGEKPMTEQEWNVINKKENMISPPKSVEKPEKNPLENEKVLPPTLFDLDEEIEPNPAEIVKNSEVPVQEIVEDQTGKKIEKIVIFYSDKTFEEFKPSL